MSTNADPNPNPAPPPAPPADPPTPPPPGDKGAIPFERFDEVNKRMKSAETELQKLRDAQTKADEDRLQSEKKFEDLATKRATERDEWKGKAEVAETRATEMEARLHAIVDERVKQLPEKLRERVPPADKASVERRLEKIEDLLAGYAETPNASRRPAPPPDPTPAGPGGGRDAEAAARAAQSRLSLRSW